MGKALMLGSNQGTSQSYSNGQEQPFFGFFTTQTDETQIQVSATEAATFSRLRSRSTGGNSGVGTFQFRVNGANGNQVCSIRGPIGTAEDTEHVDVLSAAQLFNQVFSATGTAAFVPWHAVNVQFASGHGNFHGACEAAGISQDIPSATGFFGLSGDIINDSNSPEANVAWRTRGYTSWEAMQIRVSANARTNTSDFRNRINGVDGSGLCSFSAGATGLVVDTAMGDALPDGALICGSITLGTGTESLMFVFHCATLKSTRNQSEVYIATPSGRSMANDTAIFFPPGGCFISLTLPEADARVKPGFAAQVSNLRCRVATNTYPSDATLKLWKNGVAVMTTTITAGNTGWFENTTDAIQITENDELSYEFNGGGVSGLMIVSMAGITFSPPAQPSFQMGGGTLAGRAGPPMIPG